MKVKIGDTECDTDLTEMTNLEVREVKKVTGLSLLEWAKGIDDGEEEAFSALAWITRRRTEPELRWGEVSFKIGSIQKVESDEPDPTPEGQEIT